MSLPAPTHVVLSFDDIAPGTTPGDILQWNGLLWLSAGLSENTAYRTGAKIRFYNAANTFYNQLSADSSLAANVSWTLPIADGTVGQALLTDGAGRLSWGTAGGILPIGSSTANGIVRWNGTSGTAIKNSTLTLSDANVFSVLDSATYVNAATNYRIGGSVTLATGTNSIFVGINAASAGAQSVFVGASSGQNNTEDNNVGVGYQSLLSNITGSELTAIGFEALRSNTAWSNTAVGYQASRNATTGTLNTTVGAQAGDNMTANSVTAIGYQSAQFCQADFTTAVGTYSLNSNTSGAGNTAVGYAALSSNLIGNNNIAIGGQALALNESDNNVAVGYQSLAGNITGSNNTAIGYQSGVTLTTGANNVLLGYSAAVDTAARSGAIVIGASTTSVAFDNSFTIRAASVRNVTTANALYFNSVTGEVTYGALSIPTTFADNAFYIYDNADSTKRIAFEVSGVTTGATRTATVPNADIMLPAQFGGATNLMTGINTSTTIDIQNTSYGVGALTANINGNSNVAVGYRALYNNNASSNIAVGSQALYGAINTTISSSVAIGVQALYNGAQSSVAIGFTAARNCTADNTVAIGSYALYTCTTGTTNTAVGYFTLYSLTTGASNTAIGNSAGNTITTGSNNIFIGRSSNADTIARSGVIVIGASTTSVAFDNSLTIRAASVRNVTTANALYFDSATGEVTYGALASGTTFSDSAFYIYDNADSTKRIAFEVSNVTTGTTRTATVPNANIMLPAQFADASNLITGLNTSSISGTNNTSYGANAMLSNTTGSTNVAIGADALRANTAGVNITAVGYRACYSSTFSNLTAIGCEALRSNTTGAANTAVGYEALKFNATGTSDVAVGMSALVSNINGSYNTAVGNFSLYFNSSGNYNTAVGVNSLRNATATNNTAIGANAGYNIAAGVNNVLIGYNSGDTITTGSTNLLLGYNVDVDTGARSNTIIIGNTTSAAVDNHIKIGYSSAGAMTRCFIDGIRGRTTDVADAVAVLIDSAGQLGTVSSSQRYKDNIVSMADTIIDAVYRLNPVNFTYKTDKSLRNQYGLIAEEVAEIIPDIVVHKDGSPETIQYHLLPSMLVKVVKSQKTIIDNLLARVAALENINS